MFKKKTVYDQLEAAHDLVADAINVFDHAKAGLEVAIDQYHAVADAAQAAIDATLVRQEEARASAEQAQGVLRKLHALTS